MVLVGPGGYWCCIQRELANKNQSIMDFKSALVTFMVVALLVESAEMNQWKSYSI